MARGSPWLAAIAVDSVVLGPGEKLMAVASSSKALNSEAFMSPTLMAEPAPAPTGEIKWPFADP